MEAAVPGVEVVWTRDSTGVITARVLAEKDNPRADIIWGLRRSERRSVRLDGPARAYTPKGVDEVKPVFRDKNPPTLDGMDAWLAVMCYNTVEGGKKNMPKPVVDRPRQSGLQGLIVMPQPGVVGHGLPGGLRVDPAHGRRRPGSSWTSCTRTSPCIRTRARRPACRQPRASA